jgi:hypothetical protein
MPVSLRTSVLRHSIRFSKCDRLELLKSFPGKRFGQFSRMVVWSLIARSAGRCEFRGCNEFLFTHPLTGDHGNFGENAHIVAFREGGPRGRDGERPTNIDSIENLLLLCAPCHHLIDTKPNKYPRAELEAHKREHEARIKRVTALGPAMQTTVLPSKGTDREERRRGLARGSRSCTFAAIPCG